MPTICVPRASSMDMGTSTKPGRTGTAGSLYWQVSVTGTARSPGARWEGPVQSGVSAVEKLPVVIQSLLALEQHYNTKAEDTKATMAPFSLVIGKVAGGHYETVTASRVQMRGSVYFQPDVGSVIDVMDNFRRAVTSSAEADAFLCMHKPPLQFLHHDGSTHQDPGIEVARHLKDVLSRSGVTCGVSTGPFACDVRHLVNQGGIPSIIFGPGSITQRTGPTNTSPWLNTFLPSTT